MAKRSSKFWFKNEKEVMKKLGLRPTVGSGNKWFDKEDGKNDYILAQLKSTEADSYGIKRLDITNLIYNASVSHKIPVFIVQFMDGPILLCCRPEDIVDVAKYLECGTKREVNDYIFTSESENESQNKKPVIKGSGKKEKIKQKLRKEREKIYKK